MIRNKVVIMFMMNHPYQNLTQILNYRLTNQLRIFKEVCAKVTLGVIYEPIHTQCDFWKFSTNCDNFDLYC